MQRRATKSNDWSHAAVDYMTMIIYMLERNGHVSAVMCRQAFPGLQLRVAGKSMRRRLRPIRWREAMSVADFISGEVSANKIVLFMKGTPAAPACDFSAQVVRILDHLGVAFKSHDIYEFEELRQGIKAYSDWPTIPQLYVRGEFVGGCDIVTEMFRSGELQALLLKQPEPVQS